MKLKPKSLWRRLQVRLASVRRSLFSNEVERAKFLNQLARGTREILRTQQGLAEHANYHEFCRLLGRLKTNYQLSELVGAFWVGRGCGGGFQGSGTGCAAAAAGHCGCRQLCKEARPPR